MLRNYLAASLRNLARNRLYTAINIGGLAVGLAAALVAAVYVHRELTYDHFLEGYPRIYTISMSYGVSGAPPSALDVSPAELTPWLAARLPALHPIARLSPESDQGVRVGNLETIEHMSWADPDFFDIFHFPVVAGDPASALRVPDGLVLTRTVALRLFGRADPIGETLEIDRKHDLKVMAVIEDLPSNTHLNFDMVGSSLAQFSGFAAANARPVGAKGFGEWNAYTYFRLRPSMTVAEIQAALPVYVATVTPKPRVGAGIRFALHLYPIDAIHLLPPTPTAMRPHGNRALLYTTGMIGGLILLAAIINFVNLTTARAATRQIEVGIRKASGATRRHLAAQFLGEALLLSAAALILAAALVELLLPGFDRIAGWTLAFDYSHHPAILLTAIGVAAVVGVLAGVYPASVLSAFRPAVAVRGGATSPGGTRVRRVLVTVQFAVLSGLLIAILVVFEQTSYARRILGRLDTAQIFAVVGGCTHATADAFRVLPGVLSAACSQFAPVGMIETRTYGAVRPGIKVFFTNEVVGFDFFQVYGVKPIAGRLFSRAHGADAASPQYPSSRYGSAQSAMPHSEPIILNETAVRKFGFSSPSAALGQRVSVFADPGEAPPSEVIGVVPDFPFRSLRTAVGPTVFHVDPSKMSLLSVRVSPLQQREALAAIDARWRTLDASRPIERFPVDQSLHRLYADIEADGWVFSACSVIALLLACAGIYGLSAFIAERRTKEMGVRKALGAGRIDVLRLLLWQLTKPVLWAQLLAWPVLYLAMHRWLSGYAYHVALRPRMFLVAGAVVLLIAWMTVLAQAIHLARAKPVSALRYE